MKTVWIYKDDYYEMLKEADEDDGSLPVTMYPKQPTNPSAWIEVEIPDPPKPWQGEVWVDVDGDVCPNHGAGHKLHEGCRKTRVKEVPTDE